MNVLHNVNIFDIKYYFLFFDLNKTTKVNYHLGTKTFLVFKNKKQD